MSPMRWMIAIALLSGCPGPAAPPQALEIGTHQSGDVFAPLAEGDTMAVVLGPNGLNMVVPSLRALEIDPRAPDPSVELEIGGVLMAADIEGSRVDMQPDADGYVLWDLRVPFQVELCCYNCATGTVSAQLEDASGGSFAGSVGITVARGTCPDADVCCQSADLCPEPELANLCP